MTVPTAAVRQPSLDERIIAASTAALELMAMHLGDRLGLYDVLRATASVIPSELASAAGIDVRYAREWLEQQAVASVLEVVHDCDDPMERRFALPQAHVGAVADATDPAHVAPLARLVIGIAKVVDEVADAYRTGGGVPYARYGADFRAGQGAINRPAFSTALVDDWLPALPGWGGRLTSPGGVRIADLGCGVGWSAIAVAGAFPGAHVVGIDADAASIRDAIENAAQSGTALEFHAADATMLERIGPFDVVMILEALHDMSRPVDVLDAARRALAPDGCLLVADEAVAERFTAPGDEIERMMYGWSVLHCLPASMAEQPSAALGTVLREATVRELAAAAGFGDVDVLPVDGGFFRLYALRP